MPLKILTYFRSNWFALLVIIVAILWWRIISLFTPTVPLLDWDPPLKDVDYWSLISNPTLSWILLIGFICIGILGGIFAFVYILPPSKIIYHLLLVLAYVLLCTLANCGSTLRIEPGRSIEHMVSINYQDKGYHLASSTYSEGFGEAWSSYYIFECDSLGKICSKIKEIGLQSQPDGDTKLVVSDNKLLLDRGFEQIQILPATNSSP